MTDDDQDEPRLGFKVFDGQTGSPCLTRVVVGPDGEWVDDPTFDTSELPITEIDGQKFYTVSIDPSPPEAAGLWEILADAAEKAGAVIPEGRRRDVGIALVDELLKLKQPEPTVKPKDEVYCTVGWEPYSTYVPDPYDAESADAERKATQTKRAEQVAAYKTEGEERLWEVWCSGYLATGMEGIPEPAQCWGTWKAKSFAEAAAHLARTKGLEKDFDAERLTYWGCAPYAREDDARQTFG